MFIKIGKMTSKENIKTNILFAHASMKQENPEFHVLE